MSKDLIIKNILPFDLALTLDCGQAFRWVPTQDGCFEGIAMGRYLKIKQENNYLIFYNTTEEDFNNYWKNYFDLDRDYSKIKKLLSQNETLKNACEYSYGIRILNQEPYETLFSFII